MRHYLVLDFKIVCTVLHWVFNGLWVFSGGVLLNINEFVRVYILFLFYFLFYLFFILFYFFFLGGAYRTWCYKTDCLHEGNKITGDWNTGGLDGVLSKVRATPPCPFPPSSRREDRVFLCPAKYLITARSRRNIGLPWAETKNHASQIRNS